MLSNGIRRFDLYDFFAVFIPGTTFLAGLLPFMPEAANVGSPGIIAPLIILGFAVGRAIHSGATQFDQFWGNDSHRERFISEFNHPNMLPEETVNRFFDACCDQFSDLGLCDTRDSSISNGDNIEQLYTLVRSYIHMDSRGRSRTFQAIYAFYRSMWLVAASLCVIYYAYGFLRLLGLTKGAVDYYTYISALGIPVAYIIGGAISIAAFCYSIFRRAKQEHQRYFIQYLIADFLVLYETSDSPDSGDPSISGNGN